MPKRQLNYLQIKKKTEKSTVQHLLSIQKNLTILKTNRKNLSTSYFATTAKNSLTSPLSQTNLKNVLTKTTFAKTN